MKVLRVDALLVARIVLLNAVAAFPVIEKKCEIGVEVKQRAAQKAVHLELISRFQYSSIVHGHRSEPYTSTFSRIEVAEPRKLFFGDEIQRNLSR